MISETLSEKKMTILSLEIVLGDTRFLFDEYHDDNYQTVKIREDFEEKYLKF